jgi:hypothetical protein
MITWLQNATSKHHRTIFGFLLVIVVVSFVGYGFAGRGALGPNSELRYMGVDLADSRNRQRYYFDCQTFSLGRIQGLTMQSRIAELHLADELGIPEPTEGEVRRIAREMSKMFATAAEGKPSDDGVTKFLAFTSRQLSVNEQETAVRFETFIKDTWRINKLFTTLSGKGHATASLLKRQLDRSRTLWTTDVATFAPKDFKPAIKDDEAAIKAAFDKNKEAYKLTPRVEVTAVTISSLTPDTAPITDDEIVNYGYNLAEKFKFETGKVKEQALAKRPEIEKIIRQDRAVTNLAGQVSDELAERFATDATKANNPGFAEWLKSRKAVLNTLPTFDVGAAPTTEKVPAEALRAAGELTEKEWRTEVYRTEDSVVFLTLVKRTEARVPEFKEVAKLATDNWRDAQRQRLVKEEVQRLGKALQSDQAAGKTFADSAKALGLKLTSPAPFSMSTLPDTVRASEEDSLMAIELAGLNKVTPGLRLDNGDYAFIRAAKNELPKEAVKPEELNEFKQFISSRQRNQAADGVMQELVPAPQVLR